MELKPDHMLSQAGSLIREAGMKKRVQDPRDPRIGMRIRTLRLERGLSQAELGEMLGISFQQIQKYEKGVNRVSAGRLHRVAEALHVPVTFFYAGFAPDRGRADSHFIELGFELLQTSGAIRLLRAYSRIDNPKVRHLFMRLAESVVG
jgi:transcriptional regulator with XRE-family HTH domain